MTGARHEFEFAFDVDLIRRALRRDLVWKAILPIVLLAGLAVASRLYLGAWNPVSTAACAVGAVVIAGVVWRALAVHSRRVYDIWLKQSPSGRMTFRLDDTGFDVALENSQSRYEWRGLRRLWRYPDVWIVEIVKNVSVFFPPEAVPEDARRFLVARCEEAGVRI